MDRSHGTERQSDAHRVEVEAHTYDDRTEVKYEAPQRASWLLRVLRVRPGDTFRNEWVTRFSPVHSVYMLSWVVPETGKMRPLVLRAAIFFVPLASCTTNIVTFAFTRTDPPKLALSEPLVQKAALALAWKKIRLAHPARTRRREQAKLDTLVRILLARPARPCAMRMGRDGVKVAGAEPSDERLRRPPRLNSLGPSLWSLWPL